jgi:hypothetical protein
MRSSWLIIFALVGFAGCGKDAKQRADKEASRADFWPEAPKPTAGTAQRSFKYNPDNVVGYQLDADLATPPSASQAMAAKVQMVLGFAASKTPRGRDAFIRGATMSVTGAGQRMNMHIDHDTIAVDDGTGEKKFKRGDATFNVADIVDKPFGTITFSDKNEVKVTDNPDHMFAAQSGDSLGNTTVLFPDLPTQPVAPGYKWTLVRDWELANKMGKLHLTYNLEYVGDSACPSGAKACAQISISASSDDTNLVSNGVSFKVSTAFAGKIFFDTEKSVIDESRLHFDLDLKAEGQSVQLGGTLAIKPVADKK